MKTLILGGTGWVGHHIARGYHDAGYDVTVASRGKKKDFIHDLPEGIKRVTLDKNNSSDMATLLENRFDVVVDTVPTEASIDLVHKYAQGLRRYIHCSSTGGYAPLKVVPGDETQPYGAFFKGGWEKKRIVDEKVMMLFRKKGFPSAVIRPSYITGPGMLPLDNLGGRRKDFIKDILREAELELPNDGRALLQPVEVTDLARSFLLCVQTEASAGQIYNICLAKAVTLTRYIELTAAVLGKQAAIVHAPLEEMLVKYKSCANETGLRFLSEHMCFDIGKARTQLGYEPLFSTEGAIEQTARWAAGEQSRLQRD